MKNTLRVCVVAFCLMATTAFCTPQAGLWWNPAEDGRGYGIDVQGDTIVVTTFAYGNNGQMQWYISAGKITNNGTRFVGTLDKVTNGQCLNCLWTGGPTFIGNDGTISINFTSRSTGILTLPNGRQTAIQRQNFGVGSPPNSLLGEWLYAYTIISTFAERFRYTTIAAPGIDGNGVVIDAVNFGAAEFKISGTFAGQVFAIRTNSTVTQTLDIYLYTPYLEEGRGSWISQLTNTRYGLNAYKIATINGLVKSSSASIVTGTSTVAPSAVELIVPQTSNAAKNLEAASLKAMRLDIDTMPEEAKAIVEELRSRLAIEVQRIRLANLAPTR